MRHGLLVLLYLNSNESDCVSYCYVVTVVSFVPKPIEPQI
jgi:hypothetical protein